MTGLYKGHNIHKRVCEEIEHSLGTAKATGLPKRIIIPYKMRINDYNTNILISVT